MQPSQQRLTAIHKEKPHLKRDIAEAIKDQCYAEQKRNQTPCHTSPHPTPMTAQQCADEHVASNQPHKQRRSRPQRLKKPLLRMEQSNEQLRKSARGQKS